MDNPEPDPTSLAEKLAFVEHDVETLDAVVRELHDKLDAVRAELTRMRDDTSRRFEALQHSTEGEIEGAVEDGAGGEEVS